MGILGSLILCVSNAQNLKPSHSEPLDSSIVFGKLDNGLSYYIKPINNNSSKIHFRLIVKTGYRQEVDGEYEFAHLLEHLGFVAGKNISSKKSGKLLDEAGILMAQLNGITKFDNTDYYVEASSKNEKSAEVALRFFKDIIWNLELNEDNIALERLTILDEANGGDYNLNQISNQTEREVTGWGAVVPRDLEDHIKTFEYEAIINYYKKWYHPEMMAIIVIGDIPNVEELKDRIHTQFSKKTFSEDSFGLQSNKSTYLLREPQFILKSIKKNANEQQSNTVRASLYFRGIDINRLTDEQKLRDEVIRDLFLKLLNKRFQHRLNGYNIFHNIRSNFLKPPLALKIDIVAENGLSKKILQEPIGELNCIEAFGFSSEEYENSKNELLLSLKRTNTINDSYWKNEIANHFVYNTALPSNKLSKQIRFLEKLTRSDFHSRIQNIIKVLPEDISIAAYAGDTILKHTEETIRKWFAEVDSTAEESFTLSKNDKVLMDSIEIASLDKASIKRLNTEIPGAAKYQFENGLSLILKPLEKSDNSNEASRFIRFHGYSAKGIKCYSEKDLFSSINATSILKNTGIGAMDKFELKDYLDKNEFKGYVNPYIELDHSGIKASFKMENLETALQLVYLYFNQPQFNREAYEDWKTKTKFFSVYKNLTRENFISAIRKELAYIDFPPQGYDLIKGIDQTNMERAEEIFGELFQNPKDFTFIITGDFRESEVLDLFRKYLGNLPQYNDYRKYLHTDFQNTVITNGKSKNFHSRIPLEMPMVRIVYPKKINSGDWDWKDKIKLELLRRSLTELLFRRLRFESDKGGTYQISAGMDFTSTKNYMETFIPFSAYPDDIDRLVEEAKKVVNELKNSSIENSLLKKLKDVFLQKQETYSETLEKIYEYENYGKQWVDLEMEKEFIKTIKPDDLKQTALKYFECEPLIFKMLPPNDL